MAKTYEFENEKRDDFSKESITSEEAAKKKILISQPEITSATLEELEFGLEQATMEKEMAQTDFDRITVQISEIKTALNIVG